MLKATLKQLKWVMFFLREKIWFFSYLKVLSLSFSDFLKIPPGEGSRRGIWKQVFFQRYFRHPQTIVLYYRRVLAVCINYDCNLSCPDCYAKGLERNFPQAMSVDDFLRLVLWVKQRGWKGLKFLGGEPTIHPRFTDILDICYRNKMAVSIVTNNLFAPQVAAKLNGFWVRYLSVNYVFDALNDDQRALFVNNLKQLAAKNIPFELSCVFTPQEDPQPEIFRLAKMFQLPTAIRASLLIPGLARQVSLSDFRREAQAISRRIVQFQETCLKLGIPFYLYRALIPCLFSAEDWQKLKGRFPFVCFTRCSLGSGGDYSATLSVNPDLTIFPCPAVFVKGPNILTFKDRKEISRFYEEKIKKTLSEPLMESCRTCPRHKQYLGTLSKNRHSLSRSNFSDHLCQGGCFSFRENLCNLSS